MCQCACGVCVLESERECVAEREGGRCVGAGVRERVCVKVCAWVREREKGMVKESKNNTTTSVTTLPYRKYLPAVAYVSNAFNK